MAFYHEMLSAFVDIIKAPFKDLSALWMLIPLILIWFILEVYFGTHKKEELGWNTALGNGISMFWISVELMRTLFRESFEAFTFFKFVGVLLLLLYAIFVMYISFKHSFSSKVTYALAAPTPVYFFTGVFILWAFGALEITLWVLLDLIIIFGIVLGAVFLARKAMPESDKDEEAPPEEKGGAFGGFEDSSPKDDFSSPSSGSDDFGSSDMGDFKL